MSNSGEVLFLKIKIESLEFQIQSTNKEIVGIRAEHLDLQKTVNETLLEVIHN